MTVYYARYTTDDIKGEGHHIRSAALDHLCDIHLEEGTGKFVLSEPPEFIPWSGNDLIAIGKKLNELNGVKND